MPKGMPWFRLYSEIIDDEKIRLLAFEDRWHYIAILCMKSDGLLDCGDNSELMMRKVSVKMGLAIREVDEVARRLSEVGLVEQNTLQPLKWNDRQFKSDSSKDRVKAYREKQKKQQDTSKKQPCNVTVTTQDTDTDTDKTKKLLSSGDDAGSAKVSESEIKSLKLTAAECQAIADKYNQALGDALPKVQLVNKKREAAINARFKELLNSKTPSGAERYSDKQSGIEWFGRFFVKVRYNPHWMGDNDRQWTADFDWILNPSNFAKILEYTPPKKEKQ